MTLIRGFRTELESLVGDGKGKGTSGRTTRLKVPMRQPESHCSIIARKRSNVRGAKGAGHPRQEGVNGQPEELLPWRKPGGASSGWHEPDESRDSRPDLWETRGEIPRVYPACVKKTRNRHAVRKMEVGPPEPSCRRRLQTALSCFGSNGRGGER